MNFINVLFSGSIIINKRIEKYEYKHYKYDQFNIIL